MTSFYDPNRRKIVLRPSASLYVRYHELAHKEQHDKRTMVFGAWLLLRRIRFVGYWATLLIEWDATRRSRRVMRRLGIWSQEADAEAKANLASYATQKVKACHSPRNYQLAAPDGHIRTQTAADATRAVPGAGAG